MRGCAQVTGTRRARLQLGPARQQQSRFPQALICVGCEAGEWGGGAGVREGGEAYGFRRWCGGASGGRAVPKVAGGCAVCMAARRWNSETALQTVAQQSRVPPELQHLRAQQPGGGPQSQVLAGGRAELQLRPHHCRRSCPATTERGRGVYLAPARDFGAWPPPHSHCSRPPPPPQHTQRHTERLAQRAAGSQRSAQTQIEPVLCRICPACRCTAPAMSSGR